MNVVDFPESNLVYAKDQPQYRQLPSYRTPDGLATSCWQPTWKERFEILFGAKVWVSLMTFNRPLQPQLLQISKTLPESAKGVQVSVTER